MAIKFTKTLQLDTGGDVTIESAPNGGKKLTLSKGDEQISVRLTADEYELLKSEL